ncbi:MAG: S8 family serine peptidase [Crinalium sp.]
MNDPANQPNSSQQNSPSTGVSEENIGNILQRGGEELGLLKVSDRFTIRPTNPEASEQLAETIPAELSQEIPRVQLAEFIVAPDQRDEAMQMARESDQVAFASHVYQLENNPETYVYLTDQLTIQFESGVNEQQINAIAQSFGLNQLQPVIGIPNTYVFHVTQQSQENPVKIANRLMKLSEVLLAEPNIVVPQEKHYRPKDSLYPTQWYLYNTGGKQQLVAGAHIDIERAWDITRGVRSIVVAVTDDGFDLSHPDFQGQGKIVAPRDLQDKDLLPVPTTEEENHGTACAGVAIAEENGSGIVGVAPGCGFMPIRTTGYLDDNSVEQVFDWAINKGAAVVSCSWGAASIYFPLSLRQKAALTRAATTGRNGKGCVIVFAAGNANRPLNGTVNERGWSDNFLRGTTQWLSGFTVHPDVITVSACTSLNKKSAYSNWGTNISVCAPSNNAPPGMWIEQKGYVYTAPQIPSSLPGLGILTTDRVSVAGYNNSNFSADFGGTSSAAPVVAGVAALVLSANPNLTALEVKRILQETADKIVDRDADPQLGLQLGTYDVNGYSQWFGYGKVNAFKAVQAAGERLQQPKVSQYIQLRNDNSVAIPDYNLQGVISSIQIGDRNPLRDIKISLNIEHSFLGDIEINLKTPTGQTILLQNRTLGAATQIQATYSLQTTPTLKQLLSLPVTGIWQLWIVDHAQTDTGMLKNWQLNLGI